MKADENKVSNDELDRRLQQFLLKYRVTPQATTGRAPSELFLNRKLTTVLDRLRPNLRVEVENRVETQQRQHREKSCEPNFNVGERVYAMFWYGPRRWRKGVIVAVAGPLSYDVEVSGELHRRHAAQLLHDRVGADFEEEERGLNEFAPPPPIPELVDTPQQPAAPVLAQLPIPPVVAPVPVVPVVEKRETLSLVPPAAKPLAPPPPSPVAKAKQQPPRRPPSSRTSSAPIRFDEEFSGIGSSSKLTR